MTIDFGPLMIFIFSAALGMGALALYFGQRYKKLEDRNRVLSKTLEAAPFGIVVCGGSMDTHPIIFMNCNFASMTSWKIQSALGRSLNEIVEESFPGQKIPEKIGHALRHKTGVGTIEARTEGREKSLWFNLQTHMVPDVHGNPDLLVCILADATSAKHQETQFYHAQKLEALGQLAGGVAHDFNNILSIVEGYGRIAHKNVSNAAQVSGYLDKILQAVQRGAALTRKLLTFGRHNVVIESVTDLAQIVREHKALLEPLLDASVDLAIQADESVCVDCAADTIGQILINLAVNARDAMPDGGSLKIEVGSAPPGQLPFYASEEAREKGFCYLRVADTGMGMDSETKNRIFDPFFTTKEQGKGTGLGLSMVYGVITQMRGHIDVLSAPKAGTTMTLYMPVSTKKPVQKIIDSYEDAASLRFDGYTALIAEDEPDILKLLAGMLEEKGMKVITAANGNDALRRQDEFKGEIDFLLTDVVMPKMSGVRLAELFETLRPKSRVIFMSGYPANGQMARIELPEGAFLVPKPVETDKLTTVLHLLAHAQTMEEEEELRQYAGQWKKAVK